MADPVEEIIVTTSSLFSVSKFIADNKLGFAKSNRFRVTIPGRDHNYIALCESVEFPGRNFNATDMRIYGPSFKAPSLSTYSDVNLTFLCDLNLNQKKVFDDWMNEVNGIGNFNFSYRDEYVCDVSITQYNELGDKTYEMMLMGAFPISVNALVGNWADDNYHRLQVTLTYQYWKEEKIDLNLGLSYDDAKNKHINTLKNIELGSKIYAVGGADVNNADT